MNMITYFNELVTKNFNKYLKFYFNERNSSNKFQWHDFKGDSQFLVFTPF